MTTDAAATMVIVPFSHLEVIALMVREQQLTGNVNLIGFHRQSAFRLP